MTERHDDVMLLEGIVNDLRLMLARVLDKHTRKFYNQNYVCVLCEGEAATQLGIRHTAGCPIDDIRKALGK